MIRYALAQEATYWAPGPRNRSGGRGWLPPVVLPCRWEQNTRKVVGKTGQEVVARDTALFVVPIDEAGRLALGRHTEADPLKVPASREPQRVGAIVELDGTIQGYRVWL